MNPAEKQKNDRLISFISLGLLVPFVFVVGYFLIDEIRYTTQVEYIEPVVVEKGRPLTPEEVDEERIALPTEIVVPVPTSPERASSVQVKMMTEAEVAEFLATKDKAPQEQAIVMESFSDEVTFTNVEVRDADSDNVTTQVLQGSVFEINDQVSYLTIITPDKQATEIAISASTIVYINGKRISREELRVGDTVRVEGSGTKQNITASTISVIGNMEILFSN